MWFPVSVSRPDRLAVTVGQWRVGVDNTLLRVRRELLDGLAPSLPVRKAWRGKAWELTSAEVSEDGGLVWFGFTVYENPIPLAAVLAGVGVVGGLVAAVFLVRELRRWLPVGELSRSALPYVAGGLVALFLVVALVRAVKS